MNYTYGDATWGDLLTAYDGVAISYDDNGNPLNDGTWEYTWEHGRQLASMTNGSIIWTYTYDASGMRTSRSNGTISCTYVYNGSQLSKMVYNGLSEVEMYFTYDASGTPATVTYDDVVYYYVTNLQGDVVAILDGTGAAVVQYTYDAWGKLLTTTGSMKWTLGVQNPLCYRGYVYDQELGLYYLQSRYYDPDLCRFLNADAFISTGQGELGNNMFAYCNNNPVNFVDHSGDFPWHILIPALVAGAVNALVSLMNGESSSEVLKSALNGAAIGALVAAVPQLAIVFTSYDLLTQLLDCLYAGYSLEETILVMGLAGVASCGLPSTQDELTDTFLDATIGSSKTLACEAGIIAVDERNPQKPDPARITLQITSGFVSGSGFGGLPGVAVSGFEMDGGLLWTKL